VPRVRIPTGVLDAEGREEVLSEYICDCPDCPNPATNVVGFSRELGHAMAVCSEHVTRYQPIRSERR
jgi:hypothetical protein